MDVSLKGVSSPSSAYPYDKGILQYTNLTAPVCRAFLIHHTENRLVCNEANKSLAGACSLCDVLCFFLFLFSGS